MKIEASLDFVYQQFAQSDIFHGHGIDNPWDEAVALVLTVLDLPMDSGDEVLTQEIPEDKWRYILALAKKRVEERVPLSYLLRKAWFMGLPFYVDERVLIPRSPFGEWIEKRFEPWVKPERVKRILEIGTGSGCMAIAASYMFPNAHIDAVDISLEALAVAEQNVHEHQKQDRVHLFQSDCFSALIPQHQYDLIISNPPYVSQQEIDLLPDEYHHEPVKTALFADNQGMAIAQGILEAAAQYMSPHAVLVIEVGYNDEPWLEHYPKVPFTWLACEQGGEGLFLLTREEVEAIHVRK